MPADGAPRFDTAKLDRLLDEASLDAVIATSKHNVRYLLGSYSSFYACFEAIGVDRFTPAILYVRGRQDQAVSIASEVETWQHQVLVPWTPTVIDRCHTSAETAEQLTEALKNRGLASGRVGFEASFAPYSLIDQMTAAMPALELVDAALLLEELRAIKQPWELEIIKAASEGVAEAMLETMRAVPQGANLQTIVERLAEAETHRGLVFEYCAPAAGLSFNRFPSATTTWGPGEILSLDSGGQLGGYTGDLCRMAVRGEPTAEMCEALEQVRAVQDGARAATTSGSPAAAITDRAQEILSELPLASVMKFVAHGVGLITHEVPRVVEGGAIRYEADHAGRPLQPGMVLSLETDAKVDGIGFVKLEDTVAVLGDGPVGYGDIGRDWTVVAS